MDEAANEDYTAFTRNMAVLKQSGVEGGGSTEVEAGPAVMAEDSGGDEEVKEIDEDDEDPALAENDGGEDDDKARGSRSFYKYICISDANSFLTKRR